MPTGSTRSGNPEHLSWEYDGCRSRTGSKSVGTILRRKTKNSKLIDESRTTATATTHTTLNNTNTTLNNTNTSLNTNGGIINHTGS